MHRIVRPCSDAAVASAFSTSEARGSEVIKEQAIQEEAVRQPIQTPTPARPVEQARKEAANRERWPETKTRTNGRIFERWIPPTGGGPQT